MVPQGTSRKAQLNSDLWVHSISQDLTGSSSNEFALGNQGKGYMHACLHARKQVLAGLVGDSLVSPRTDSNGALVYITGRALQVFFFTRWTGTAFKETVLRELASPFGVEF